MTQLNKIENQKENQTMDYINLQLEQSEQYIGNDIIDYISEQIELDYIMSDKGFR